MRIEPITTNVTKATWVTVDKPLVSWAYRHRTGREVFGKVYGEHYAESNTLLPFDWVPCENDCDKLIHIGEQALVIVFLKRGRGKKVFYSVECQRQNFLKVMGQWLADRRSAE